MKPGGRASCERLMLAGSGSHPPDAHSSTHASGHEKMNRKTTRRAGAALSVKPESGAPARRFESARGALSGAEEVTAEKVAECRHVPFRWTRRAVRASASPPPGGASGRRGRTPAPTATAQRESLAQLPRTVVRGGVDTAGSADTGRSRWGGMPAELRRKRGACPRVRTLSITCSKNPAKR